MNEIKEGDTIYIPSRLHGFTTIGGLNYCYPISYDHHKNTSIGFFIIPDGYSNLENLNYITPIFSSRYLNENNNNQSVMLKSSAYTDHIVLAFEDIHRPEGDHDFNDAIILIKSKHPERILNDPFIIVDNVHKKGTMLIEDHLCSVTYSAIIGQYDITWNLMKNGKISEINIKIDLTELDNKFDNAIHIKFDELPSNTTINRTIYIGNDSHHKDMTSNIINDNETGVGKYITLIESSLDQCYPSESWNTEHYYSTVILNLKFPFGMDIKSKNSFNETFPFSFIVDTYVSGYFLQGSKYSFYSDKLYNHTDKYLAENDIVKVPKIIFVPDVNLNVPSIKTQLHAAYPKIISVLSENTTNNYWYNYPNPEISLHKLEQINR